MSFVFSPCTNGFQYFTVPSEIVTFANAEAQCASQGGQLAIPRSLNQFNTILEHASLTNGNNIWIGLEEREDVVLTSGDTERFIRIDGERNSFTAESGFSNFPWLTGEPNNFQGTSEQCVDLVLSSGLINDIFCTSTFVYLCERSCSSECTDGLELSIAAGELLNLTQAEEFCEAQGAQLAVPTSIDRLNDLTAFASSYDVDSVILGLVDTTELPSSGVTDRFLDVNGLQNGFTNRDPFLFPWGSGEPTGDLNKNCVELNVSTGLLRDTVCEQESYTAVCEKSCGTKPAFVFDTCTNGIQLYFNPESKAVDEALVDCKNVDPLGTLAVPRDQESIDRIGTFRLQQSAIDFVLLGLRNFEEEELNASLFLSMTGEANNFTAIGNQNPWNLLEPNNEGNNEFCLSIRTDVTLNDVSCDRLKPSVCERPCDATVDSAIVFDQCVDATQLFFNSDLKSFDEAQESCKSIDSSANLAIPTTASKFAQMQAFQQLNVGIAGKNFIGLRNFALSTSITEDFLTVNNQPNPFTSGLLGLEPWAPGEPNFSGAQFCGTMFASNALIDDFQCELLIPSLCERYCGVQPVFEFGECVDNIQFYFNPELRNWDAAQADCRSIDPQGKLAIPTDQISMDRINALFEEHRTESSNAHIGLRDFIRTNSTSPDRFIPFEGIDNLFTGLTGSALYVLGEPDNVNGLEDCIATAFAQGFLFDGSCDNLEFSVCQRPCDDGITESPTLSPTTKPTRSPTQRLSKCTRRTFGITNPTEFF